MKKYSTTSKKTLIENFAEKLNDICNGPCLPHCYSANKIAYIAFGIFIGLVIGSILLNKSNGISNLSNLSKV